MQELDPTFSRFRRLQHQLDCARLLGLGEPDLGGLEVVEVSSS